MRDPDFLHEAPNRFACAAFSEESRMKFAHANKLDRKSGGPGFPARGSKQVRVCGFQ